MLFQSATELIKEIAILEVEVTHLEQYLLSLYRKAFDQQVSSLSPSARVDQVNSPLTTPRRRRLEFSSPDIARQVDGRLIPTQRNESSCLGEEKFVESNVNRCQSSLSQCSALSNKNSPPAESLGKALRACHSQPLSMAEVSPLLVFFHYMHMSILYLIPSAVLPHLNAWFDFNLAANIMLVKI